MCGIAGYVDFERPIHQHVLRAMADTVACRGPDAEGFWSEGEVGFAHRRLFIIDPAGGGQPMVCRYGSERYVLNYNGELYNTAELRDELRTYGHVFTTRSDTEVLLRAFVQWREDCLRRLNGIFAFAIWDESRHMLFLARDPLGVKPLFYTFRDRSLIFGSELKAILAHPAVDAELDADGLAEIFALGPSRTPGFGVLKGISELRPGHFLAINPAGLRLRSYWQLESRAHEDDIDKTAATVGSLLRDSVQRQLVSDVPISTLLSGGLDSSAVTAIASAACRREGKGQLRSYSVDFKDQARYFQSSAFQTNLDAPWVEKVAAYLGTDHRRIELDTPDLIRDLRTSLVARDLPGMADVDTSLLVFCREIKRESTVALSGEAADEIFGGYPWCHMPDALAADTFPWNRRLDDRMRILSRELCEHAQPLQYVERRYREALAEVPRLPGEDAAAARIREVLYLNITRFLPTLLDRKDRMSMASGLEVRVPFCDHRLVSYVWNIPWSMKNAGGLRKGILRLAVQGDLPEDVVRRPKSPYPSTHHPSYGETLRGMLVDLLHDQSSPLLPLIDKDFVGDLAGAAVDRRELPWFSQLMGLPQLFAYLLQTDMWLREYGVHLV